MEFTSAATSVRAGSCATSIRPLANLTSAFSTPGSASSAFSIFGTQEGQESSSLRRMVRALVLVIRLSFRVSVLLLTSIWLHTRRTGSGESGKEILRECTACELGRSAGVSGRGAAGSLSGAARSLGVNHSTVFRRIAGLEETLGVRL